MSRRRQDVATSFQTAFGGIVKVVQSERNARIHLVVAVAALVACVLLRVANTELAAVFFAIIIVFVTEIVNTALERTLDLVHPEDSEQVRLVKDIMAGAVLVASAGAVAIGLAVFLPYLGNWLWGN